MQGSNLELCHRADDVTLKVVGKSSFITNGEIETTKYVLDPSTLASSDTNHETFIGSVLGFERKFVCRVLSFVHEERYRLFH